mmetsp:Transcript_24625/g.35244  ORF Transcript_24625/g.35244 Transcript_24625/m.35244 type:complete len:783 (-) Transcript_24625:44-2392(-)
MNFVHRILKASSASSSPTVQKLVQSELQHAKLIYFGEFHGESRIISFQTQLVKELTKCYASSSGGSSKTGGGDVPTLHLIMEHFSQDMQPILDRYQQTTQRHSKELQDEDENKAFEELVTSYKEQYGTEGHNLHPYRELLQFCRRSAADETDHSSLKCKVKLHGGFIPRNQAARLNKEEYETKHAFFQEMSGKGYLPKEAESMHHALFERPGASESLVLRGSREHQLLIQSLMSGEDIYTPIESEDEDVNDCCDNEKESKISRLYQAQLLKDHAMGYKIASLMMQHAISGKSDRYMVITGLGHLKHYTGVPECVNGYLRQEALLNPNVRHRNVALDLLLSLTRHPIRSSVQRPSFSGIGSALIGCQMMYEVYLEETYPPMIEAAAKNEDNEMEEDVKRKLLNDLYLRNPDSLDQYILNAEAIRGPLLHYSDGLAGFQKPCADFLFVYDEDDENEIDEAALQDAARRDATAQKCPFHPGQSNNNDDDAKAETIEAYERVGQTAGVRGNSARARAIMTYLGYTDSDLEYVADDIFNFQGVANPHTIANIQQGECILDIGSGLGIDSFLAARNCGADVSNEHDNSDSKTPFVVGVDIAQSEVNHAMARAVNRGLVVPDRVRFVRGDVEKLNDALVKANLDANNLFDVCISNGAFCLVPDKRKAFENVFKALRPGGRMAISTTTVSDPKHLDPSFEWPVCVRMFANLDEIQSMCESIGFKNVQVMDAASPLEGMELPEDEEVADCANDSSDKRFKIHGKYSDQYEFLQNIDMDALCKVVTVYGEKP